jgi:hypothetical protein
MASYWNFSGFPFLYLAHTFCYIDQTKLLQRNLVVPGNIALINFPSQFAKDKNVAI